MRTRAPNMRMVVHGGGWWCVEDGGGVCGQSSQACFHAASVEMDNLTLTRRSSTYAACAHVPPICPNMHSTIAPPMALVPKNTKTNSTINTKHNQRTHLDRRFSTPRFSKSPPCKYKREEKKARIIARRCHAFKTSI